MSDTTPAADEESAVDLLVKTRDPARIDEALRDRVPAFVMQTRERGDWEYAQESDGVYAVRCFTAFALRFAKWAIPNHEWGEIVGERTV